LIHIWINLLFHVTSKKAGYYILEPLLKLLVSDAVSLSQLSSGSKASSSGQPRPLLACALAPERKTHPWNAHGRPQVR
ncbi:rho GTPase-activating protein 18-like X4, partial [Biomphalaria glabrata]